MYIKVGTGANILRMLEIERHEKEHGKRIMHFVSDKFC